MILNQPHRLPTAVVYLKDAAGWVWHCIAERPWYESWYAYRCFYLAGVMKRARVILESCRE